MSAAPARTAEALLAAARRALSTTPIAQPGREARLLLGHVLGRGEAWLLAHDDAPVETADAVRFESLVERRRRGEPAAYLLGEREFYGRPFFVDARVLVPRPETEHLVEAALALELPAAPRILDVGTGSGCLAVTLALEIPGAQALAGDLSLAALAVARANAARHGVAGRVRCVAMDLAAALRLERVDLVVSNPPYVDPDDPEALAADVRDYEPHLALFAADRGRAVLDRLLATASAGLRPGTRLLLEIGYDQLAWLERSAAAPLELERVIRDYAGIPRTAVVRSSPPRPPSPWLDRGETDAEAPSPVMERGFGGEDPPSGPSPLRARERGGR